MKKNNGYVLAITTVMLVIVSMLIILAYSLFVTHYSKSTNDYKRTLDRLSTEVIAQEVYVESTNQSLDGSSFIITIENTDYLVLFNDSLYSYKVNKVFEKYSVTVEVTFNSTYQITTWKVWSDFTSGNNDIN